MPTQSLLEKLWAAAGHDPESVPTAERVEPAESLIGLFQSFRPDGHGVAGLFEDLDVGAELEERLGELFETAGDDRRPQGGRDAYFVVRQPQPLTPDQTERLAGTWWQGMIDLARAVGKSEVADGLGVKPHFRVLEGIPPKHPKRVEEKSKLHVNVLDAVPELVTFVDAGEEAVLLRPAYYFTACDPMLRDYLMWPLYARATQLSDPFQAYFQLWRHGVKYRIFGETQVDLYLPRQTRPELIS